MFTIVSIGMIVIGTVVPDAHILVTYALLLGLAAFVFELIPQIGRSWPTSPRCCCRQRSAPWRWPW